MIKLKSILLMESLKLVPNDKFSEEENLLAKKCLIYFIKNEWPYIDNSYEKMIDRFEFTLSKIRKSYKDIIFTFDYSERLGKSITMKPYRDAIYTKPHKIHNNDIKNKLDEIPHNENSVYRGISFEEALYIKKSGYIFTNSSLTLSDSQEGYTFFGTDPKTAHFYAAGFQPLPLTGTRNKPPVIIEVPKEYTTKASETISSKTSKPVGSNSEYVSNKPIPVDKITNVWFLVSKYSSFGNFDVIYDIYTHKSRGGSRSPININHEIISKPDFFK